MTKGDFKWSFSKRVELQGLLKLGYSLNQVVEMWKDQYGYSPTYVSIKNEVKKGLSEDDYKMRLYLNYDVYTVYLNLLGEDVVNFIKKHK